MRIRVRHETIYRYAAPVGYGIQYVRLTPRTGPTQQVLSWRVSAQGRIRPWVDSHGNLVHVVVMERLHQEMRVTAAGEVETVDTGGLVPDDGALPPVLYVRPTRLTAADEPIRGFAAAVRGDVEADRPAGLHRLMHALRDAVAYEQGTTGVTSTAAEALAAGAGVCQDHTHLFIACCRALGVPARYVSGYLLTGDADRDLASHAWAEAWIDGTGWMSFDVSNRTNATPAHVRLATGLDYLDASPIRGVRRGGGGEDLEVRLQVAQAQQ